LEKVNIRKELAKIEEHCPKAENEVEFLIAGLNITSNEAGGKPNF